MSAAFRSRPNGKSASASSLRSQRGVSGIGIPPTIATSYAGDFSPELGFVVGLFAFRQTVHTTGAQEQGSAAARFLLAPSANAATPVCSTVMDAPFVALDASHSSDFTSSSTPSRYLVIDGYSLINGRLGFRGADSWDIYLWVRNLADEEYFEFLSAAPGGSGFFVGNVGDPRTYGITLRGAF